jgi:hypothetical protein
LVVAIWCRGSWRQWQRRASRASTTSQGQRQRAIAKVDRRPPYDAPFAVDDQSEPASAAKEGEPMTSCIIVDATLASARDCTRVHQPSHLGERYAKPLCYELGSDLDVAIDESDPGQGPFLRPAQSGITSASIPVNRRRGESDLERNACA